MLSRVADALYWLGRYLERAENVTRLLLVTSELSVEIEGLDERLAQAEWDDVLAAVPGAEPARLDFSPAAGLALPYISSLLLDEEIPVSVQHSLGKARENARSVREALTREVFLNLNEAFRELDAQRRKHIPDPASALDVVGRTHQALLTTLGAIEHTLSRDQGWVFMKLGEAIERTERTLLILRAKLPSLRIQTQTENLALVYARWRGLLRALASLENFRRRHGAGLDAERVLRFVLFDRSTPRSVYCGLARMHNYLGQLPGDAGPGAADRIVGKLLATLTYDDEEILGKPDLDAFCDLLANDLARTHEAITRQYFAA